MKSEKPQSSRKEHDNYPTPHACVPQLLDVVNLPGGRWLEPCAGSGRIIEAVQTCKERKYRNVRWVANEIRNECRDELGTLIGQENVFTDDFLGEELPWPSRRFDVAITNPPYKGNLPISIIKKCRSLASWVVMLLRLDFLSSQTRYPFMRDSMPDVYVVPDRIKFVGRSTDSYNYGWFVWPPGRKAGVFKKRAVGKIMVLDPRP